MSAGYIQLAAIGQQDAYLTGSPQVTYFAGAYRRHTPFVLEAYDIPFLEQQVRYGQNNICRIPPKGDLVRALTLKLTLPALNNPGGNWTWPLTPSPGTVEPRITVTKLDNTTETLKAITAISAYSTINFVQWFSSTFGPYVSWDAGSLKFSFKNCKFIEVEPPTNVSNSGVFWGLDPKAPTSVTASGNLVYTVNTTRVADFTLEQGGWVRSAGLTSTGVSSGLYTYLSTPYTVSGLQFLNLAATGASGTIWSTYDFSQYFTITSQGRVQFRIAGYYTVRAGFDLVAGSVSTFSYGSSTNEAGEGGGPANPNFESTYTFRVSPNPSAPAILPLRVTDTSNAYYLFMSSTGSQLKADSYISINPVDEIYQLINPITINTQPSKLNFYGNVAETNDTISTLTTNSNVVFAAQGEYLVTGTVGLASGYVSNVTIWESSNLVYNYDMKAQGRDPTFAFTMPIRVTDTFANYYMNVTTTTSTTILPSTYFIINQIGVENGASPAPDANVLAQNGLLFQPQTTTLASPFNLATDFTSNGTSSLVSFSSSGLKFSGFGTYVVSGAICTKDPVTSITFGSRTYNVGLGILPPYTFQIPLYISDTTPYYQVSITTAGSSGPPNIFSNTFIAVYPITTQKAANITQTFPYYDSVGTWAIQTADLKIGGQTIQSISGEYIELWNDLHVPYENQPGLTVLTGKNDASTINPPGRTYFVNLPFYFYGNPSLYLPLVALSRHDVEVHVTFRKFSELTEVPVVNPTLDATIIVEYVYLSEPEINWFRQGRLEYLITQCQYQSVGLIPNFESAVFGLDFKNPVREMFFIVQPTNQPPYDYSNNAVISFGMSFNGQDVFTNDATDALYTGSIEPFNHYPNYPQRKFFMYSFTAKPNSPKPAGQINFSRIKQVLLRLECGGQSYLPAKELRILAVNYNVLRIADGLGGILFNT
jgi:hypothetical protein